MTCISRRDFVVAAPAVVASAAVARPAFAADVVRIGYIGDFNGASLAAIATDQNFGPSRAFSLTSRRSPTARSRSRPSAPAASTSVMSGPARYGCRPAGRAKVIAINNLGQADRVIAQAGVRTLADLKGKKVGAPEGTSGDMLLRLALRKQGMAISDIQLIRMDPSHGRGGLRQSADRRGRHLVSAGRRDQAPRSRHGGTRQERRLLSADRVPDRLRLAQRRRRRPVAESDRRSQEGERFPRRRISRRRSPSPRSSSAFRPTSSRRKRRTRSSSPRPNSRRARPTERRPAGFRP